MFSISSYTILMDDGVYEIPEHPGYIEIPKAINNLKNIENL